ncbi:type II toxin-antitoxin system RelE/ParE family toxin [Yinghuangia seranimata]|uniref:type II toxin-antitoxin system RelE/ParE family toxin n=1 Tax=Yinghuangia seranimata TaxID=408067 RepID=UPI00248B6671|nr:type II toxin-antitoxin system RelE/ParE family toxin [Yinghuangia seranimata]MDI2131794.1 type II toxin-antitoxin system RelE/ParE family toxin [Yinghuangia seranimata]
MAWRIIVLEPALSWLRELRKTDRSTAQQVGAALTVLSEEGPALGRPLVDTVRGSSLSHLKELRPGSSGSSEVRLLFIFDPDRNAVVLVAGDKSGQWSGWYAEAIPLAELVYEAHLAAREG